MSPVNIPALNFALWTSQVLYALFVLGISIYVTLSNVTNSINGAAQNIVYFLIIVSTFAVLTSAYIKVLPRFSMIACPEYVQFALSALIAFLFMTLTVALAVILARSGTCSGPVCIATKADALFSGFSYALWTITALLLGISLSKPKDRRELDVGDEKIDALRRKSAY